jgi:hypothetical protein
MPGVLGGPGGVVVGVVSARDVLAVLVDEIEPNRANA